MAVHNINSTYYKTGEDKLWKLLEFLQFLLIFVYILISAIDGTTKIHYSIPDKRRHLNKQFEYLTIITTDGNKRGRVFPTYCLYFSYLDVCVQYISHLK